MDQNEERYTLTPKALSMLALRKAGLVNSYEDPRIDGFWELFVINMKRFGYLVEDDEE